MTEGFILSEPIVITSKYYDYDYYSTTTTRQWMYLLIKRRWDGISVASAE
jgi:hypothetical protein